MTSNIKQCTALTGNGKGPQCSRNAEEGSDYCWQHEKSLENTLLEEGVLTPQLAEILQYAGEYKTNNPLAKKMINNELKEVRKWYINQKFKIPFEELHNVQIPFVIDVYNQIS
jgi:hypothetical protein